MSSVLEKYIMQSKLLIALTLASFCSGQSQRGFERPVREAVRGTHGAVAAGSEFATEAGMRIYYKGGNAVDAGIARCSRLQSRSSRILD